MKILMSSSNEVAALIKSMGIEGISLRSLTIRIEAGKPVVVEIEKYVDQLPIPILSRYHLVET